MHIIHDPNAAPAPQISFDQFLAVDIPVGTIIAAKPFPEARKPAFKLEAILVLALASNGRVRKSLETMTSHPSSADKSQRS